MVSPLRFHNEPRDELGKLFGRKRELATFARMRTDRPILHTSNRKVKGAASSFAKLASFLSAGGAEIHMDMIASDRAHMVSFDSRVESILWAIIITSDKENLPRLLRGLEIDELGDLVDASALGFDRCFEVGWRATEQDLAGSLDGCANLGILQNSLYVR